MFHICDYLKRLCIVSCLSTQIRYIWCWNHIMTWFLVVISFFLFNELYILEESHDIYKCTLLIVINFRNCCNNTCFPNWDILVKDWLLPYNTKTVTLFTHPLLGCCVNLTVSCSHPPCITYDIFKIYSHGVCGFTDVLKSC